MSDINTVFIYFKELLDIPDYYCFKGDSFIPDESYLHGRIDNIYIYIVGNTIFKPGIKINDKICITDCNNFYDLLLLLDDYIILIINDIIKTLGGVIYEKTTLLY